MLEGILTALVTPLKNDTVDGEALARLIDRQLEAGVDGIVVCATTGEGSILDEKERHAAIRIAVARARGKTKIVVGTGCISTAATITQTRAAKELGADAALVVSPPYVRPSQEGIAAHYERIADEGGLPIIAYNVPSRTASDIALATLDRLAAHGNIVGLKEATVSAQRVQQVLAAIHGRMAVLAGDDPVTLSLLVAGGQGVISTGSNVVPKKWVELWRAWKAGDVARAAAVQASLLGLHEALFLEANPGPVKGALNLQGLIAPEIRMPLTWPGPATMARLAKELEGLGLEARRPS